MQTISSYILCTPPLDSGGIEKRVRDLTVLFDHWLAGKGAALPLDNEGFFKSKTQRDNTGIYRITPHNGPEGTAVEYVLEEKTKAGLDFTTRLVILSTPTQVTLYATLMASSHEDAVTQTFTDARCPKVVRDAINLFSDWRCFDNELRTTVVSVTTSEQAFSLAQRLKDKARRLPIVVVSEVDGEEIWQDISSQIAYDLSGAAEVIRLTEEVSGDFTNAVGKINSCYLGAIRIYWPKRGTEDFPRSTVWTAPRLLPEDEGDDQEYSSRFRSKLRNSVFAAMSVSVQEPKEIASIKRAEIKERIAKLEVRADDHNAALALIDDLQKKNEGLLEQLSEAQKVIATLKYRLESVQVVSLNNEPASNDASTPPRVGEVRFYKKISDAGNHDKFKLVNDCNHNNWQSAKPADKARKGIMRHEGRDDWNKMQHCAECTGPGMWRVQW